MATVRVRCNGGLYEDWGQRACGRRIDAGGARSGRRCRAGADRPGVGGRQDQGRLQLQGGDPGARVHSAARDRPGRQRRRWTGSRWTSSGRARAARPTRCRRSSTRARTTRRSAAATRAQCMADWNSDNVNDRWPLFLDNYFVPRGYAYILAQMNGTGYTTNGCPMHGGPGDIAGEKSIIDWLNGRVAGLHRRRPQLDREARRLAQRQLGHDRQVLRRHAVQRRRRHGRRGPQDDRPGLGDLGLVQLLAHRRRPPQHELPGEPEQHRHHPRWHEQPARRDPARAPHALLAAERSDLRRRQPRQRRR